MKGFNIKPISLWMSVLLFGLPAIYFILITKYLIPYFNKSLLIHPALSWFIGGMFVFLPLFLFILYYKEGKELCE